MADMLRRQIELLRKIPRQTRTTIDELTRNLRDDGHVVSKRTVERDIELLAELFEDLDIRRDSQPYSIGWSRRALPTLFGMSEFQAVPLLLVDRYLKSALPPPVAEELAPLIKQARNAIPTQNKRHWIRKIRITQRNSPIPAPVVSAGIAQTVFDALIHDECLTLDYAEHGRGSGTSLEVEPYWVIVRDEIQFLVARQFKDGNIRAFRMHRITRARPLTRPVRRPSMDIETFLQEGGLGGNAEQAIDLQAIFYDGAGDFLFERNLGEEGHVTHRDDGTVLLELRTILDEALRWWLFSFCDRVRVTKPESLAQELKSRLERANRHYR